jgi:glycolate oxidase iron-sulfur subunit
MQTHFTLAQLADADTAESEKILRACVHCGFCTATCPTYVLLGDELDSPRGRIYLIKDMLEHDRPASAKVVKHIDRCLSCLSCMTTCPSGVHYMHLVDHARAHIEETYVRPWPDRLLRQVLQIVLPRPTLFRLSLLAAGLARPWLRLPGRLGAMLRLAPAHVPAPSPVDRPQVFPAEGARRLRVALLNGCAQRVVAPQINEATIRLLTRHGCEIVVARGAGCCGALVHHMGQKETALAQARANIDAWSHELAAGLDAIVINTSGCGTTIKDYGFMLRDDPAYAAKAARISALARDVSEVMADLGLAPSVQATGLTVAYHAACSLQHGQKIVTQPKALLAAAGFVVRDIPDGHLCCGSAGTYNLLQPELAGALRDRKIANIETVRPDVIAAGNVGCITQLAGGTAIPVVHTVELLDWATGGPRPAALG